MFSIPIIWLWFVKIDESFIAAIEALLIEWFRKLSSYFCFTFLYYVEFCGPWLSVWLTMKELLVVVTTVWFWAVFERIGPWF